MSAATQPRVTSSPSLYSPTRLRSADTPIDQTTSPRASYFSPSVSFADAGKVATPPVRLMPSTTQLAATTSTSSILKAVPTCPFGWRDDVIEELIQIEGLDFVQMNALRASSSLGVFEELIKNNVVMYLQRCTSLSFQFDDAFAQVRPGPIGAVTLQQRGDEFVLSNPRWPTRIHVVVRCPKPGGTSANRRLELQQYLSEMPLDILSPAADYLQSLGRRDLSLELQCASLIGVGAAAVQETLCPGYTPFRRITRNQQPAHNNSPGGEASNGLVVSPRSHEKKSDLALYDEGTRNNFAVVYSATTKAKHQRVVVDGAEYFVRISEVERK